MLVNAQDDEGIGYDVIIGHDIMLQLGLKAVFGCQIMEWDNIVVPLKETGNFLGQPDLTKRGIQ